MIFLLLSCKTEGDQKKKTEEKKDTKTEIVEKQNSSKRIVFFGDSLTAGYGLEDVEDAFPGLIQKSLDSLELDYKVVNSGVSGETTAGGRSRIDWILSQEPSIFVLELGANDGLRGVPLKETRENLQFIINAVKNKYPQAKIVLAGMQLPPNMGQDYTTEFRKIFPDLAQKNNLALIPFLLQDVGGIPELNQADGIHPTVEGHKILAKNVWPILKPLL